MPTLRKVLLIVFSALLLCVPTRLLAYAYCGNDPVNRHDPLGLMTDEERTGFQSTNATLMQIIGFLGGNAWTPDEVFNEKLKTTSFLGVPQNSGLEIPSFFGSTIALDNKSQLRKLYPWWESDLDVALRESVRSNTVQAKALLARSGDLPENERLALQLRGFGLMAETSMDLGLMFAPFGEIAGVPTSVLKPLATGPRTVLSPVVSEAIQLDARLLTAQTHRAWSQNFSQINRSVFRLGKRAVRMNSNDWRAAEAAFERYIDVAHGRLVRMNSPFRLELQPASVPGLGRVSAFVDQSDLGILREIAYPGSRRLDAGVVDITGEISVDGLYPVLSGFDITINPLKPDVVRHYQEAFGPIPIFDIRP